MQPGGAALPAGAAGERARSCQPLAGSREDAQKAVALLDRAIAAKGGLAALRGLHTIVAKQTLSSPQRTRARRQFTVTTYSSIRIGCGSRP